MFGPRVATFLCFFVLGIWFGHLASEPLKGEGRLMMKLELSFTPKRLSKLLSGWKERHSDWRRPLLESLRWDTWFICSYAPFCCLLVWVAAEHFQTRNSSISAFGQWLAAGQLFAGFCDFVENAGLNASIVSDQPSSPWTQITSTFSAIKWLLIFAAILFVLGTLIDRFVICRLK